MARYYDWNIKKIIIYPFGGVTVFQEHLNKPIKQEFAILIMGPIFQMLFYLLISFLFGFNYDLKIYHYSLLFFNLLPIYPLDGNRLLNLLLQKCFSFNFSHILNLYASFLTLIISFSNYNLILYLILIMLIFKNIKELKEHKSIFNKFLLERYLYNFKFKKIKIIQGNNLKKMKRDYRHFFVIERRTIDEKQILRKLFDFKANL